jgi:hypothetical protein
MWSYYGAKTNIVKHYPPPKHQLIIEPFAGTARYALEHFENDVMLVDKYEVIIKIWKWLQQCSPKDILSLPRTFKPTDSLDDYTFDCEESKLLMGFLIAKGVEKPRVKPTEWATVHRPNYTNFSLKRIAQNLYKIKHWKVIHGSYTEIENRSATWFIDPPYFAGGRNYVCNNKHINFSDLSAWARAREGQVIVCENMKATWMDFKPMLKQKGSRAKSTEAIWTNEPTTFDHPQTDLFGAAEKEIKTL